MLYEVHEHYYGRRLITKDGPCQGLLEWPEHKWVSVLRTRSWQRAVERVKQSATHAVACEADCSPEHSAKAYGNAREPLVPEGWWHPTANTCMEPRG